MPPEEPPRLWVLAGGNGAGKSTFHATRLARHGVEFVNADLIERELDPAADETGEPPSYRAARMARARYVERLERGTSFCYETVFSHPSKVEMIAMARAAGYRVTLVFIHLADPALNVLRVRQRVSEGGHSVPTDKIAARIPRTLAHVRDAVRLADETLLLDNGRRDDPFRRIAERRGDDVTIHVDPLPAWAREMLGR